MGQLPAYNIFHSPVPEGAGMAKFLTDGPYLLATVFTSEDVVEVVQHFRNKFGRDTMVFASHNGKVVHAGQGLLE